MSQSSSNSRDMSPSAPKNTEYPPQLHAGAVGLGPEFAKGATTSEKIDGLKEEIKGKIKHDPELVEHGRDKRTGALKRKEAREDQGAFGHPGQTHPDDEKQQQEYANQERPDMKMVDHPEDKE